MPHYVEDKESLERTHTKKVFLLQVSSYDLQSACILAADRAMILKKSIRAKMNRTLDTIPRIIIVAISLSLLAVLLGFVLGGFFGLAEDSIKKRLDDSGTSVLEAVYDGDVAEKNAVVKKSWEYLKRAHLHGGAIGSVAIGCILILVVFCRLGSLAKISAVSIGAGALLYSAFWLLAGFLAPSLGSTGNAKEALSFVAIPGAGLCLLGVVGTLLSVLRTCFTTSKTNNS